MSWKEIFNEKGFSWVLQDLWYRMFSWKSNPYSIKKYLQRNVNIARQEIKRGRIPTFKAKSRDELVLKIFKWVTDNFNYLSDEKNFGYIENWEDIDIILDLKVADCESLSALVYAICRVNNINPLQIGYIYGGVKKYGDHVFVKYQADETMKWYIIDPAYSPRNHTVFKYRKTISEETDYVKKMTCISDFELK